MENSTAIGKSGAQQDLARRELARRHLIPFAEYLAPWYQTQPVHTLVAKELEEIERYVRTRGRQGNGRLVIQMPPRHGKTEEASKLFPAWFMGRNPNLDVIITSYSDGRASENSRGVRGYINSPKYRPIFGELATVDNPVQLSQDSRAVMAWDLGAPHRGGLRAAGVGGGLTGSGAHLLIADDLYKGRREAESDAYRKQVIDWWGPVVYTRLEDWAAIVIIMTRWHPDDIVGHLLKEMVFTENADQWRVLSLPALALEAEDYAKDEKEQRREMRRGLYVNTEDPLGRETGKALWPSKFDVEQLNKIKANIGPYDWGALYEQAPRPRTGGFFSKEWDIVERAPEGLQWFRYWDLAASPKKKSDRTGSAAVALDFEGTLYIRDLVKWRAEWPVSQEKIAAQSDVEDPDVIYGVEDVAFQMAAFQDLAADKRMVTRAIYPITPEGNKEVRAYSLQSRQALGKVKLVRGPWIHDFIEEALGFPKGEHDDQVDMISGAMQMIREFAELESEEQYFVFDERVHISPV